MKLIFTQPDDDTKPATKRARIHRARLKAVGYGEFVAKLPDAMIEDIDRIKQQHGLNGRNQVLEMIWRKHRNLFCDPFGQGQLEFVEATEKNEARR